MGTLSCNKCSKIDEESNEMTFTSKNRSVCQTKNNIESTERLKAGPNSSRNNTRNFLVKLSKKINESLSADLRLNKDKLLAQLSQSAEIQENCNLDHIFEKLNPTAKDLDVPSEIIEDKMTKENFPDVFYLPLIKFSTGEIYEGFWNKENKREGYGVNINPEGSVTKGFWRNDSICDYGVLVDKNGAYYKGELNNKGQAEGKGEMYIKDQMRYVGDFYNDLPNGKGTQENLFNNSVYEGDIVNAKKEGYGTIKFEDGSFYKGHFLNDCYDGKGKFTYACGREYEGEYKKNLKHGKGVFTWENGQKYEGSYVNDIKQGYGILTWNQDQFYKGNWINNKPHGEGEFHLNGKAVKGQFRFGKLISRKDEEGVDILNNMEIE